MPSPGAPAIVLVEPQLGENIGAAARAMANFGLTDLRLVAPRDGWPSEKARASASRPITSSTARAYSKARRRFRSRLRAGHDGARPRPAEARGRPSRGDGRAQGAGIGRRGDGHPVRAGALGLTNEEIALADVIVTFPVNPAFASLNIAQAVLLMSYEWMASGLAGALPTRGVVPTSTPHRPRRRISSG